MPGLIGEWDMVTNGNGLKKMATRVVIELEIRTAQNWLEWFTRTYVEPRAPVPDQVLRDLMAQYGKVNENYYIARTEGINDQIQDDLEELAFLFDNYIKLLTGKSPVEEQEKMREEQSQGIIDFANLLVTPGVQAEMTAESGNQEAIGRAVARFDAGNWGNIDEEDVRQNEQELERNGRLMGIYPFVDGTVFWIIRDRGAPSGGPGPTTILLPSEY